MKKRFFTILTLITIFSLLLDVLIVKYITDHRIFSLDDIITKFSILTNGFFSLIVIGIIILVWKRKLILDYLIGFGITAIIIQLLKVIIQRPRPYLTLNLISLIPEKTGFSFPSGHAGFAFFTLGFIWNKFPKFKWAWLIITIFISFSRIYTGIHYLSDILASAIIGLFIGIYFSKNNFLKKIIP